MAVTAKAANRLNRSTQTAGTVASHYLKTRDNWLTRLAADPEFAEDLAERGQTNTVVTAIIIGVVGMVGIAILGQAYVTMPDTGNSTADNTTDSIFVGILESMDFLPLVVLVLFAALVIGVVQRFR